MRRGCVVKAGSEDGRSPAGRDWRVLFAGCCIGSLMQAPVLAPHPPVSCAGRVPLPRARRGPVCACIHIALPPFPLPKAGGLFLACAHGWALCLPGLSSVRFFALLQGPALPFAPSGRLFGLVPSARPQLLCGSLPWPQPLSWDGWWVALASNLAESVRASLSVSFFLAPPHRCHAMPSHACTRHLHILDEAVRAPHVSNPPP